MNYLQYRFGNMYVCDKFTEHIMAAGMQSARSAKTERITGIVRVRPELSAANPIFFKGAIAMTLKKLIAVLLAALTVAAMLPLGVLAETLEPKVASIKFDSITLISGADASINYGFNSEEEYVMYYKYNYTPDFTVIMEDGTELTSTYGGVEYNKKYYELSYADNQSAKNPWGVGTHRVDCTIMGFETAFDVEIVDTPISGIEIEPIKIVKETDGYWDYEYDENSERIDYFRYDYRPDEFTVNLKDGTKLESSYGFIEYNSKSYAMSYTDTQNAQNSWGIGVHKVAYNIMGFDAEFEVEIVETPIESIEFDKTDLIYNVDGYNDTDYLPDEGNVEFFRYYYTPELTVKMKDGSVQSVQSGEDIQFNGKYYSPRYTDDQSGAAPWGVGTHTVSCSVLGYETSFEIEVIESPVKTVEFEDIRLCRNTDGYSTTGYNEAGEEVEYFYYTYRPKYTVILKDGTKYTDEEQIVFNGQIYNPNFSDDQSADNPWDLGTHKAQMSVMGFETEFTVEITESPIKSIEVQPIALVKNADGYIASDYVDGEQVDYYRYNYTPFITVTFLDGTSSVGRGYIYYNGSYYDMTWYDTQSAISPWDTGTHTVKAQLLGFETTFDVEIVKSPIESIEVDISPIIKNTSGQTYYSENSAGEETSYFHYEYRPTFKVNFSDGSNVICQSGVSYNDQYYNVEYSDDQSINNPWDVGTHTVNAQVLGFEFSFDVEITESPVASIKADRIELIKDVEGYNDYDYVDGEEINYFRYTYRPNFTVTMTDGTVLSGSGTLSYKGNYYDIVFSDDQSASSPWGVGSHTVTGKVLGFDFSFTAEVIESPIKNIEIENISIIEKTGGSRERDYEHGDYYYRYSYNPTFTVTFNDGTVQSCTYGVEYNGKFYEINYTDTQSAATPWEIGNHIIEYSVLGFSSSFSVEIVETPVESVEFSEINLIHNADGSYVTVVTNPYSETTSTYFVYYFTTELTVKFKDGSSASGVDYINHNGVTYTLDYVSEDILQSADHPWTGLGTHTIRCSIAGFETSFDVNIVESPVEKAVIEPVTLLENIDGDMVNASHDNNSDYYFRYSFSPQITLTLKDGTVLTGSGSVEYNGRHYTAYCMDNQSYNNPWGVGTHTVECSILGYDTSFTAEVVKNSNTVTSVQVDNISVIQNVDGYTCNDFGNSTYFKYDYYGLPRITVTFKDGSTVSGNGYVEYNGKIYSPNYSDNQSSDNPWELGKHTVSCKIMGYTAYFTVEVIESPVESISVRQLTLFKNSGGAIESEPSSDGQTVQYYKYKYVSSVIADITMKDGSVIQSFYGGVQYNGKYYNFVCTDDQSADNPWDIGMHTAKLAVLGCQTDINIEIAETPVKSVLSAMDVGILNNTEGHMENGYDANGKLVSYYRYNYYSTISIILKDGSTLNGGNSIFYNGQSYNVEYRDGQSAATPWGIGTHKVTGYVMGYEFSFNVEIMENNVQSVKIDDVSVMEGTNGYISIEYDSDNNPIRYFRYSIPMHITVTMNDGSVLTGDNAVYYNGYQFNSSYYDNQTAKEPWGVGKHTVTATVMGKSVTFSVEITESPIASVTAEDVSVIVMTDGYKYFDYSPDKSYFRYSYQPMLTVTFKDGTVIRSNNEISYNGTVVFPTFTDYQSFENQWGVGVHKVYGNVMGIEFSFNVTVNESPVAKIEFDKITLLKNADGNTISIDYGSDDHREYFEYWYGNTPFTVTMKDGSVIKSTSYMGGNECVVYNGKHYFASFSDDQSIDSPWGVGAHKASASLLGCTTTVDIDVVENPAAKIEVSNVSLVENVDGILVEAYEDIPSYFYYIFEPQVKATLKNGTVITGRSGIEYNGRFYELLCQGDDQSAENPWGLGKHTITGEIMGFDVSFTVEIISATPKTDVPAPGAPAISSKTATDIILIAKDGYEYKMDNGQWQASNVFSGLMPDSEHIFYQRVAETATTNASPSSKGTTVRTEKILKYTVTVNGTVLGTYAPGENVSITATAFKYVNGCGSRFNKWISDVNVTFANRTSASTYFIMPESNVSLTNDYVIVGDADGNGRITVSDVNCLKKMLVGIFSINSAADVDGDGRVSVADVNCLKRLLVGTYLPRA